MKNQKRTLGAVVFTNDALSHMEFVAKVVDQIWAGKNFKAVVQFESDKYWAVAADNKVDSNWDLIYSSASGQGQAQISPDGKVIKASVKINVGIVGAYYILEN